MSALANEAGRRGIRAPTTATLKKYGLTADAWLALLAAQGWVCPICDRDAARVRLNTDHEHVPGWRLLPPEERVRYVRGVLCVHCNYRLVPSRMGSAQAEALLAYVRAYEARQAA